ncbi:OLC1v1005539C1 [Oldenlandia corymbosa var. corymbosa]|uniref:OLC1v1005539C1 n=1 Tax=Oldenlandia corymbosa var. corymbosa TaxID=529605 RepID=A0AAV1DH76_OLDCO|nr:OLC1v1005539C1 [Oldenlandia corymbosa var. corymbosa]
MRFSRHTPTWKSWGVSPDYTTLPLIFKACANLQSLQRGKEIHNVVSKSHLMGDARRKFEGLIRGQLSPCLVRVERCRGFSLGQELQGCCLRNGLMERNDHVRSALIIFISGFGLNRFEGTRLLDSRNIVCRNTMISRHLDAGENLKTVEIFIGMLNEGIKYDDVTVLILIRACIELGAFRLGVQLHQSVMKHGLEHAFHSLTKKHSVSWNAIIAGYGMHGRGHDPIIAFSQMLEEGFMPTGVTFVSVLSACSHSSLVEKGLQLYNSTVQEFNTTPKLVHYACVVDLLSRCECLNEAMCFINSMPIAPDACVWRALLGGC